jgi:hypothetical protein
MGLSFALFGLVMCAGQLYLGCGPPQCGRTNFLLIGPLFYIGLFCVHGPTLAGPACSCTMHHGLVHSIWVRVTIICDQDLVSHLQLLLHLLPQPFPVSGAFFNGSNTTAQISLTHWVKLKLHDCDN